MMTSAALSMLLLAAVALLAVTALLAQPWWIEQRRRRLRARPLPPAWRRFLRQHVPLVARLPPELQLRLKGHIQVLVAEKPFIGCRGQVITEQVRVTIAAHAGLLLLGHPQPDYYPRLRQILVYPDAFVVNQERPLGAGLVQEQRHTLSGESWPRGS
jgi:Mlc titration factor MtfA (ptsG expression regulator)